MSEPADPRLDIETRDSSDVEFRCENCSARVRWDPDADALLCDHCGHSQPVPRAEGTILERPLEAAGDAARGLGLSVRISQCDNCGARVSFSDAATAVLCVYCGSSSVLLQEANRNALRPESLVPMDIGRAAVDEGFRRWLKSLWFRPNDLQRTDRFQAVGIYVPFWTFDCRVHSDWSADAGYYYYVTQHVTVMVNGKPTVQVRRVRKIRWEPAWGQRDDSYDDLLVGASRGVAQALLDKLGPYDTTQLVPYRPEYLAGWQAEEYQLDLDSAWNEIGQPRVESSQRERCSRDVPGDTQRDLRVRNLISEVRWKHVLLPLWSLAYVYRGKSFTVLVHGQTGRVVGEAPYSWIKILLAVLGAATVLGTVVVVANS